VPGLNREAPPRYYPTTIHRIPPHRGARSLAGIENCGNGLPSAASFCNSAKVWPEPAKSSSAKAGLKRRKALCCRPPRRGFGPGSQPRIRNRPAWRFGPAGAVDGDGGSGAGASGSIPASAGGALRARRRGLQAQPRAGQLDHDLAALSNGGEPGAGPSPRNTRSPSSDSGKQHALRWRSGAAIRAYERRRCGRAQWTDWSVRKRTTCMGTGCR